MECVRSLCQMGGFAEEERQGSPIPGSPASSQWWRLPLSLVLHSGLFHMLLVVVLQLMLGWPIERAVGGVRVAIIYSISGLMALLASN